MRFQIYQNALSNTQIDEVNAKGWSGVSWGRAYMDVTAMLDEGEAAAKAMAACEQGLYVHQWTVNADDVEQTFPITNYMGDEKAIIWRAERALSGSVGDVAVALDETTMRWRAWVCCSFGWTEMTEDETAAWRQRQAVLAIRAAA